MKRVRSARFQLLLISGLCVGLVACGEDPLGSGELTDGGLSSVTGETTISNAFGSLRLRCEVRPGRSEISVDGDDLAPGTYAARVFSGAHSADAPATEATGDEVEFDFDSEADEIADGATAIARDFIDTTTMPHVGAELLDGSGAVLLSVSGNCRYDDDDGDEDDDDDEDEDDEDEEEDDDEDDDDEADEDEDEDDEDA
ncbi:MAG: hypothetical protein MJB57_03395 [Gemmatimonadetes bacterium]|nr:hypothetical protein [Gemmatimonadota bacterium]